MAEELLRRRGRDTFEETSSTDSSRDLASMLRLVVQGVGLLLVLVGCYFGVQILSDVVGFARNPQSLDPVVAAMAEVIQLKEIPVGGENGAINVAIDLGRTVSMFLLLLIYLLSALVCYLLLAGGSRLALGVLMERREFLAAMKEFLITLRAEGVAAKKTE